MARVQQLQVLRGVLANRPALNDGEFYFATDQFQLYVGFGGDSLPVGGTMAVNVQGHATNNYIEPNADGSLDVLLAAGGSVSLGNTTGKTAVLKTGQLTTTAVTANQIILSYSARLSFYSILISELN